MNSLANIDQLDNGDLDAIIILETVLARDMHAHISTWCVRSSAMWKIQSAIRYLAGKTVDSLPSPAAKTTGGDAL
jgi:hypothetical protein